tara:strand:+ start:26 stop:1468 length:1443 start_codon:yes stop_codon:yes gene_type:complete
MEKSFIVNSADVDYVINSFHNSTLLQMCRQMINTHLLNNGIEFCKGGCKTNKMKMDAEVEELIDEKWIPFASEAIDSILCCGFCVVSFAQKYPSILKQGTYRIKVNIINNEYEWHVLSVADAETEVPKAVVFDHFGLSPRTDGKLTSPVSKILPRLEFLKKIRETAVDMELRKANPYVYSEIKENTSSQRQEGVDYDFYADAGATETNDDMQFSRNKSAVEMLNRQKELYEQYMGRSEAVRAQQALANVVQLPMGQHVVNAQMTSGRTDLVATHKIIQEEVCAVIGVPRSMMFADSGVHRGDSEGIHNSFMHTLLWYKKKLGVMLSDCYNRIYTDKIMKGIDFTKEKNVYEAKKKYKVQVFFPITPFVPNDELRRLYEQGVISWDSYATYALRNVSLPLEDKQKGPPPIDELLFEKPKPKEVAGKGKVAAEDGEVKPKAKDHKEAKDKEGRGSPNPETAQIDKKRKSDDKDKSKNKKAKK